MGRGFEHSPRWLGGIISLLLALRLRLLRLFFCGCVSASAQFWGSMTAASVSVWLDTFRRLSNSLDMPWLPLDLDVFLHAAVALVQRDVLRLRLRLRLWEGDLAEARALRHLALLALPVALRLAKDNGAGLAGAAFGAHLVGVVGVAGPDTRAWTACCWSL